MKKIVYFMMLFGISTLTAVTVHPEKITTIKALLHQLKEEPKLPRWDATSLRKLDIQFTSRRENWAVPKGQSMETFWNLNTKYHATLYIAWAQACIVEDEGTTYPQKYYALATDLDAKTLDFLETLPQEIVWYCLDNSKHEYSLADLAS